MAKSYDRVKNAFDTLHVYYILHGFETNMMKGTCKLLPKICESGKQFLLTDNTTLDDPDRF